MEKKKFCRVERHLRIALGVIFEGVELPSNLTEHTEGVYEVRTEPVSPTKAYLNLDLDCVTIKGALKAYVEEGYVDRVEVTVPPELREAPYGEILLNDNKPGALVRFGRQGETRLFSFRPDQRYIMLRLYPEEKAPDWKFNPLYVRVDRGEDRYFFCLKIEWRENVITVEVEREAEEDVPAFLWLAP